VAELDKFLAALHKHEGSDLHIATGITPALRIQGTLTQMKVDPIPAHQVSRLLDQVMSKTARAKFTETGDADFIYELEGVARFRCNVFINRTGPAGVFRLIPLATPSADQLGLGIPLLNLCGLARGLILITSPVGGGRSTTQAAIVDFINESSKKHIIALEDTIEFVHTNKKSRMNQRDLSEHTQSIGTAIKAAMRGDPDVVVLSDLSNLEQIEQALAASDNGVLVVATMRAASATAAIQRMLDQFPPDRQGLARNVLARNLKGVLSQYLCPRKDGRGRVAARELLIVNDEAADHLRANAIDKLEDLMVTAAKDGMVLLNDALVKLVLDDVVDAEDALEAAVDVTDLNRKLAVAGIGEPPIAQAREV